MKQLKPQDAQFLFMEDGKIASHVTSVMICDQATAPNGLVRFKEILSTIENRLSNAPLYSQKLMRLPFNVDFPYWVEDPHFDLEYHVRHGRLPEPADWRQLCIHIARIHSRPLDMSRPLWEVFVIEGLTNVENYSEGSFAIVVKMHHSAVDGTSAQEFMFSMMDAGPDGPPLIPPPARRTMVRESTPTSNQLLTRAAVNNATAPLRFANAALRLGPTLTKAAARRATQGQSEGVSIPSTRFNGEVSPNRAFDAAVFALADFKTVCSAFNDVKINDVVLAVCSGALRTYLSAKKELPKETLVITAPVNKRSGSGSAQESDGNNISAMTVPLFTNIPDPLDRLKAITIASQSAKAEKSGLGARVMTDLSKHVPPFALATLGPLLINSGLANEQTGNAIVSNVAGLQFPIYFCGAKVSDAYALAPIGAGMGLFIATPSYDGRITFNVTTTRQMMPDTPFFIQCLKDSLDELLAVASTRKSRVTGKKATKRKTFHRTRMKPPMPPPEATPKAVKADAPKPKKKKKKKKSGAGAKKKSKS